MQSVRSQRVGHNLVTEHTHTSFVLLSMRVYHKMWSVAPCAVRWDRVCPSAYTGSHLPTPGLPPSAESHLQCAVSTPRGHWLLCKEVPAGCRDKNARG